MQPKLWRQKVFGAQRELVFYEAHRLVPVLYLAANWYLFYLPIQQYFGYAQGHFSGQIRRRLNFDFITEDHF